MQAISWAEYNSTIPKGSSVFVMGVQQYDMSVRALIDDCPEDGCKPTGFSRSSGTDDAEMLAEQLIYQDIGRYRTILVNCADRGRNHLGAGVNLGDILCRGEIDRLVQRRIGGESALKVGDGIGISNLTDKLELDEPQILMGSLQARQRYPEARHHAVSERDARPHLDQGPHLEWQIAIRGYGIRSFE